MAERVGLDSRCARDVGAAKVVTRHWLPEDVPRLANLEVDEIQ